MANKKTSRPVTKRQTTTKKLPAAQPVRPSGPRRLKSPQYKSLRLSKRLKHPVRLPSIWHLTKITSSLLWRNKRLFIGITLVYGVLNYILVRGLSSGTDAANLKSTVEAAVGNGAALTSSLTVFAALLGSSGSSADASGSVYQLFLLLFVSLALIWALRELLAGASIRVRDAYYRGMYPLVPFILVLLVIGLQLLPLVIGASVYSIVISQGIAVYAIEKIVWALLFGLLALLSVYMISSSVFALYIVTLPDMTPLRALRSARALVRYRRWTVLRKVIILPVILLLVSAAIIVPIILVAAVAAPWVFYVLTMFSVAVVHGYLYSLYRELLHEQN